MIQRCVFAFAALTVLLTLSGCATGSGSFGTTGKTSMAASDKLVQVDELVLYNACLERCRRDDQLARMTVKGCVPGCDMARKNFALTGKTFSSEEACINAVQNYEVEEQVRDAQADCDETFSHLYHRKGCKDAADAYYRILFPALCKGVTDSE